MFLMLQDMHSISIVNVQQEQSRRLKSCTQNAAIGDRLRLAWCNRVLQSSCKCYLGHEAYHKCDYCLIVMQFWCAT